MLGGAKVEISVIRLAIVEPIEIKVKKVEIVTS